MARTLIIMRHAKSSWSGELPDHRRPLNGRGRREAPQAGEYLARHDIDRVLCSTATRTRETWDGVQQGGATAGEVTFHDEIYEAPVGALLSLVRSLPDGVGTALLVGHFPGVAGLVDAVAERDEHPGWTELRHGYPTRGIVAIEIDGDWADAGRAPGRMIDTYGLGVGE